MASDLGRFLGELKRVIKEDGLNDGAELFGAAGELKESGGSDAGKQRSVIRSSGETF